MTTIQVKSFTLEEYHQLTEIGCFKEDDSCARRRHHIQLINGELIEMAAKGTAHETCLRKLWKELPILIGNRATLQSQAPIIIPPKGEPKSTKSIWLFK